METSSSATITTKARSMAGSTLKYRWIGRRYPCSTRYGAGAYRHKPIVTRAIDARLDNLGLITINSPSSSRRVHPQKKIAMLTIKSPISISPEK